MKQPNSIKLESPRLYLIPLTYDQLLMYSKLDYSLELGLNLFPRKRTLTDEFKFTLESYLLPYIKHNPLNILYATIWVIIHKELNMIVGDIGFNSAPSEKGVIEVGYSTYQDFMNNGYMTEALGILTAWAFDQDEVHIIVAQTDKDNFPTHKVLEKNQYMPFVEVENSYWWRCDKDTHILN